ncbi:MAG: PAS domain S-box protein [Oscillatoria princeps RMCB-10]|jgi:PAS domain S-box-containing protein|nr:PAS domain S-box protein [Oscillatoria princeps RMCB-10]
MTDDREQRKKLVRIKRSLNCYSWLWGVRVKLTAFSLPPIANQLRYGLVLLVVFISLLTGSLLAKVSFDTELQQSVQLQQQRSLSAAREIDAYLDDLQRKLSYLARVRGLTDLPPAAQQNLLEALTRHNSAYETVALLDRTGEVVSSVSPYEKFALKNLGNTPLFLRAFKQKEDYVGTVEIDRSVGVPVVTLAVPVRDDRDRVDGVLLARINLKFLWFIVSQTQVGATGYAYAIDNRFRLIAQKGSAPETAKLEDLSDRPFIAALTKQIPVTSQSLNTYKGLKGVEVLGAIAPVRSVHWKVIVELPTAEAYAPLRQMLRVMALTLAVATAFAGALGLFFSQEIISPLQRLTAAATQISSGNLDIQVSIRRRNEMGVLANTFNHMTDRLRQLIEEVQKERNFVSAVLETAGALIVVIDRQGRIVTFNHACERTTGYSFSEVRNQYLWDLFLVPEEIEAVRAVFENLRVGALASEYENCWLTKDGRRRLISWSNTVLLNNEGEPDYAISIGIDVTEQKQAEELRQAKETAEAALRRLQQTQAQLIQSEKMASLGQLVAGVAHEINNPVSFIYGNLIPAREYASDLMHLLELYQTHCLTPHPEIAQAASTVDLAFLKDDFPRLLDSMRAGAERIRNIVVSLRNFSRLDESDMKKVDIHEGIESTLLILQNRLKANPHRQEIQVIKEYGNLPLVECYAGQLNQVFVNLLTNAIDAIDEIPGKAVTIWIKTEVLSGDSEGRVAIRIRDSGTGIAPAVEPRLFDPFFTTKPVGKGTGLGLSVSYQIVVEKHGGRLSCVSPPGEGAEFALEIPVRQQQQKPV